MPNWKKYWPFSSASPRSESASVPQGAVARLSEAVYDSAGEDEQWRSDPLQLSDHAPYDDLPGEHAAIARKCYQTWLSDALGGRIVEIPLDFIIGGGFALKSDNEAVHDYINKRWAADPTVRFYEQAERWINDLLIIGEFGLLPEINPVSGFVRYEPLDISSIRKVYRRYGLPILISAGGTIPRQYTVAYAPTDSATGRPGPLAGELLYTQINTTSLLSRGYGLLLRVRDWLAANNTFIFGELSRVIAQRRLIFHYQRRGASQAEIDALKKEYAKGLQKLSLLISTERDTLSPITADIKAGDTEILGKIIRQMVLSGAGLAEHWLAEGGDVNRATAGEMSKPILRRLTRYQTVCLTMLKQAAEFARDQAILAGAIPGVTFASEGIALELVGDPVDAKNENSLWALLAAMLGALNTGVLSGLIGKGEARQAVAQFLSGLDIELEDLDAAEQERLAAAIDDKASAITKLQEALKFKPRRKP